MSNIIPFELGQFIEKISNEKKLEVQDIITQIFTGTEKWEEQIENINVTSVDDIEQMNLADLARKNVKQARLSAEKLFEAKRDNVKKQKESFDLEDKLWLKAGQIMSLKFKDIESKAEYKASFAKRVEAEKKESETQKRIKLVYEYRNDINRFEFENMSDEAFSTFINGLKIQHQENLKKQEEERLAKEEADRKYKLYNQRQILLAEYKDFIDQESVISIETSEEDFQNAIETLKARKQKYNDELNQKINSLEETVTKLSSNPIPRDDSLKDNKLTFNSFSCFKCGKDCIENNEDYYHIEKIIKKGGKSIKSCFCSRECIKKWVLDVEEYYKRGEK